MVSVVVQVAHPARGQLNRENYNGGIGNIIFSLSSWERDNPVSRNGFVAERSKCLDKSKHTTSILC